MITRHSINLKNVDDPCFAMIGHSQGCRVLMQTHERCGSYKCPFYKPKGCKDWVRIDDRMGVYQPKDEPQPFDKPPKCLGCLYSDLDKAFHPCASCVDFGKYVGEVSGKDEPQTEPKRKEGEK